MTLKNILRATFVPTRATLIGWGRFFLVSIALFAVMSVLASALERAGIYDTNEINSGLLIEMMGAFVTLFAIFLNWDLRRIDDEDKFQRKTEEALAKNQVTLEEIKTSIAIIQEQQPVVTPTANAITSSTQPVFSRATSLLVGTLLSAILIILLRRTHKPNS